MDGCVGWYVDEIKSCSGRGTEFLQKIRNRGLYIETVRKLKYTMGIGKKEESNKKANQISQKRPKCEGL